MDAGHKWAIYSLKQQVEKSVCLAEEFEVNSSNAAFL